MWPNPQESADLVTFTEETLNAKLQFLCSVSIRGLYGNKIYKITDAFPKISGRSDRSGSLRRSTV